MTASIKFSDVSLGDTLPEQNIEITSSLVVGGALASQDFTPVHHDRGAAHRQATLVGREEVEVLE